MNNLFAGRDDESGGEAEGSDSDGEQTKTANFQEKMKRNVKKDKIIKNYGTSGLNKKKVREEVDTL